MKIHPTSIIHDNSKIDDSVEIGPFCIIDEGVEIKKGIKSTELIKEFCNKINNI